MRQYRTQIIILLASASIIGTALVFSLLADEAFGYNQAAYYGEAAYYAQSTYYAQGSYVNSWKTSSPACGTTGTFYTTTNCTSPTTPTQACR